MKYIFFTLFTIFYFLGFGADSIVNYSCNTNISDIRIITSNYLKTGEPDSAVALLQSALKESKTPTELFHIIQGMRKVSEYYFEENKNNKAYKILSKVEILSDSLIKLAQDSEKRYINAVIMYSEQENKIEHLNHEKSEYQETIKKRTLDLEKQRNYTFYIALILALFIITLSFTFFLYHKHLQTSKKHRIYSKKIAQQKEEIEVQKQHLIETNAELEKLSIIARQTDNGVRIINAVGRVLWINDGYTKMFGYTLDELQSVENHNILGTKANVELSELIENWYGNKKPISFQVQSEKKCGEKIWVQTSLTPILNDDDKIDRMIAIDSDITRIKNAEFEIQLKNEDITSSIAYAKRIQEAMLSPFSALQNHFPNSFCYYKPKDIVSGDFYWMTETENSIVVVCADGTGHGVPGAFISLLGISFLSKIVKEKGIVNPAIILNKLKSNIINHLNQDHNTQTSYDGIDMSVITIDKCRKYLEYSGAMNSILINRNNNFIEIQPDKMPVGFFDFEDKPFSNTRVTLFPKDQIFMYTDGYYDQFGGEKEGKMKSMRFKKILTHTLNQPTDKQLEIIDNGFNNWRGNNAQIDDVLILGITI